jgi:hypothetical protein
LRNKRKLIAILVCLSFVMSLLVPMSALAWTQNRVTSVPTLSDDATNEPLGKLTLMEDSDYTDDLLAGKSFTVTFPSGVKLQAGTTVEFYYGKDAGKKWYTTDELQDSGVDVDVKQSGDYTLDIKLPANFNDVADEQNGVRITPVVNIDGFDGGDIEVVVDGFDSGITSGTYVLGRVIAGETTARVLSTPTVGEGNVTGGIIRITENSSTAIGTGSQKITVKLPANFTWVNQTKVDFLGGLSGLQEDTPKNYGDGKYYIDPDSWNTRTLTIYLDPQSRTQRGIIQITPWFSAESDAKYGEVEVSLDGDEITSEDLVIANYADFGVNVSADGDVEEVLAGQIDAKLTKLLIKENVAGSLLPNRKTRIEFPKGVKIVDFETSGVKNINQSALNKELSSKIDGTDNYVEFIIPDANSPSSKIEFKVKFIVSIEAGFTGDIVAEVSGRSGAEGEAVLGVASAPVKVTTGEMKNLTIGLRDQAIGDIIITETVKGAIMEENYKYNDCELRVVLPEGIEWSKTPDVEVEGNLEIEENKVDTDDNVLIIPIKSESTRPSQITISNAKVDLDRTIPEGDVTVKIQGTAVVENFEKDYDKSKGYEDVEDAGLFDTATAAKGVVARVATPAPGDQKNVAVFKIGESSFTLNGVEIAMDVAPYLQNDRTYLPVRFAANVCGVSDDNIMWNPSDYSVVMIKGDRIVKLVIGSNTMLINGVPFNMDVAPEIVDPGRTMLPLRWVAQALGCSVDWDPVNYTVTLQ